MANVTDHKFYQKIHIMWYTYFLDGMVFILLIQQVKKVFHKSD